MHFDKDPSTVKTEAIAIAKEAIREAATNCSAESEELAENAEYDLAECYRVAFEILAKLDTMLTIIYN